MSSAKSEKNCIHWKNQIYTRTVTKHKIKTNSYCPKLNIVQTCSCFIATYVCSYYNQLAPTGWIWYFIGFLGKVTKPWTFSTSSTSPTGFITNCCSRIVRNILTSTYENTYPGHLRRPWPNGANAIVSLPCKWGHWVWSNLKWNKEVRYIDHY